jgi:hypothetical protein
MAKQAKTVLGLCPTYLRAEEAVDKLRLSGFRNTDVLALMPEGLSVLSGVLSWPAGSGISKQILTVHEDWLRQGGIVVCVRCTTEDWEKRAERVFENGAMTAAAG